MQIEEKIRKLGFTLPVAPKPIAKYVPAKKSGNLVFTAGQGPIKDESFAYIGKVGEELSIKEGVEAAKICTINCLASLKDLIYSLDNIDEIIKVTGYVNSSPHFFKQPEVINGASELIIEIFGKKGEHARTALGVSALPFNIPVELEMIVSIKQ